MKTSNTKQSSTTQIETLIAKNGKTFPIFPSRPFSSDEKVVLTRLTEDNSREAEAILFSDSISPIQKARTFIKRGKINEAKEQIEIHLSNAQENNQLIAEYFLEKSRIAVAEARWSDAIEGTSEGISKNPHSITLMTLMQVRSVAHFEIKNYKESLQDIDAVLTLQRLYPKATNSFYAKVTKAKIFVGIQKKTEASSLLQTLWKENNLSVDEVLTLLRAEIDLNRLLKKSTLYLSAFCVWICENILGDDLYAALGRLDMYLSINAEERFKALSYIENLSKDFKRVAHVLNELDIGNIKFESNHSFEEFLQVSEKISEWKNIIIPERFISLHITKNDQNSHIVYAPHRKQLFEGIDFLSKQSISRQEFFEGIWNNCKFNPRLHDNLIRTLISRIRSELSVDIVCSDGFIDLKNCGVAK